MTRKVASSSKKNVDELVVTLVHPHQDAIQLLRRILKELDPRVIEEMKWNAPSFRTSEHFATLQPRFLQGVQLILHFGAKKRDTSGVSIADPDGFLQWLGPDRASVKFRDAQELETRRAAFERVLRDWIAHV